MFFFRCFMAEKSIIHMVGFLTIVGRLLSLPIARLYFGFHRWTSALTGGIVDARFIALVDTALESPLGQVAMTPMPAWIAQRALLHLKATFFAVMTSSTNLALLFNNLGSKYLNQLYVESRTMFNMGAFFEENT
jgi:hypothetical protein